MARGEAVSRPPSSRGMRPSGRVAGTDAAESRIPDLAADRLHLGFVSACSRGRRVRFSDIRARRWRRAVPRSMARHRHDPLPHDPPDRERAKRRLQFVRRCSIIGPACDAWPPGRAERAADLLRCKPSITRNLENFIDRDGKSAGCVHRARPSFALLDRAFPGPRVKREEEGLLNPLSPQLLRGRPGRRGRPSALSPHGPSFLRRPGRDLSSLGRFVLSSCGRGNGGGFPRVPAIRRKDLRTTGQNDPAPRSFGKRDALSRRPVSPSSCRPREAPGSFLTQSSRSPRSVCSGRATVPCECGNLQ